MVNLTASLEAGKGLNGEQRAALLHFALLALALTLLFSDAAISMASIWIGSSAYHHGLLVAPVSIWLILRSDAPRETTADWLGARVIVVAFALLLLGRAAEISLIGHAALVGALIGAVIAVYGRGNARRWSFPLAFLFFMVPFGEEIIPLLQHASSIVVAGTLNLSGVETAREGFILTTGAGRFEIARSCSGLRFILASAMIASLVGYLAFTGWRRRIFFVAAALAIALVANWLRAYAIIALATATDMRLGVGPEHVVVGWAFYMSLLGLLLWIAHRTADAPPLAAVATGGRRSSASFASPAD